MINISAMNKPAPASKAMSVFSLTRLKKECYLAPITVDFTPLSLGNQQPQSIVPKFNQDRNFFTSAFINPYQQFRMAATSTHYLQNEKEKFLKKVQLNLSQPDQQDIEFNPRGDHFCSICQQNFERYWQHINSKSHLRKIKSSKANTYIHDLCSAYKKAVKPKSLKREDPEVPAFSKKKKISKTQNKGKKSQKDYVYNREDFIIRIPKQAFSKEQPNNYNYNMSTNGANSIDPKE